MKPFRTLPEFEHFTPAELDKVHEIIRSTTYAEASHDIHVRYGIKLSTNKLFRYLRKLECAEELSSVDDDVTVSVNDYLDLLNGKPVPFSAAGIQVVLKRAFELACSPSTSASLLKDLFRMFTYEDRQSLNERKFNLAQRIQQFREDQAKARKKETKRLTPEEVTKKFQEIFGMRPVTPEDEPAPDADPTPEPFFHPSPASHNSQLQPSTPTPVPWPMPDEKFSMPNSQSPPLPTQLPPISTLDQSAIEDHARRRASSYLPQPPGQPPIARDETWKEECPCGQKLPCSAHGELWREVRHVKPWDPDYAAALRRHNIPITPTPTEPRP